jgi:hypothetical protein
MKKNSWPLKDLWRVIVTNKTTIFSLNPITGKPFMAIEDIQKLIKYHVTFNGGSLIGRFGIEDLVQDCLLALVKYEYKPDLSAPKTFVLTVAKSTLGKKSNYFKNKGRNLEVSDYLLTNQESGESIWATSLGTIDINPEDYLLAKEKALKFRVENIRNALVWGDKLSLAPSEYKGPSIIKVKNGEKVNNRENYWNLW